MLKFQHYIFENVHYIPICINLATELAENLMD